MATRRLPCTGSVYGFNLFALQKGYPPPPLRSWVISLKKSTNVHFFVDFDEFKLAQMYDFEYNKQYNKIAQKNKKELFYE